MRRRDFIAGLGAAAVPLPARAQQAMPVIGVLRSQPAGDVAHLLEAFREGLRETGYVDGHSVAMDIRGADSDYGRLPSLAAELVARRVNVIVTTGAVSTVRAAMKATASIPIVFVIGSDPVENQLVASLNRPGANVTGATMIGGELLAKRFELLRELVPDLGSVSMLVNRENPNTEREVKELNHVANAANCKVHLAYASREPDIAAAFQSFAQAKVPAFLIGTDALFSGLPRQIADLAAQHRMPAIYARREYVAAGGLGSYGSSPATAYRTAGVYTGRILKGAKPAELPVMLPTKFELAINLKTAKALGLAVPPTLLARADEVIE